MKTEDFDEAIRKKLESLNQTYTESDIDKVYHQVMSKRALPWKGFKGSWLFYSLSAAAITVISFWMVSHFRNNTQSHPTKEIQKKEINVKPADTVKVSNDTLKAASVLKAVPPLPPSQKLQASIPALSVISTQKRVSDQKTTSIPVEAIKQEPAQSAGVKAITQTSSAEKQEVTETPVSRIEPVEIKIVEKDTASIISQAKVSFETPVITQIPEASYTMPTQNTSSIKAEISPKDLKQVQDTGRADQLPKTGKTFGPLFKGAEFRTGADFRVSNQVYGMGITAELLLKNNLSLQTGLNYSILPTEHYANKEDLFGHKHHDFNHRIEDHLANKDHVSAITIDNKLIQIPVSIRYYVPLKRNYSLCFSLGTDLDIYVSQKLGYNRKPDTGMMGKINFNTKGDATLLNNFVISAGLEKRWKSLSFQLQPFFSPQIKEVFYKPKQIEFGLGIGINYGF